MKFSMQRSKWSTVRLNLDLFMMWPDVYISKAQCALYIYQFLCIYINKCYFEHNPNTPIATIVKQKRHFPDFTNLEGCPKNLMKLTLLYTF